MGGSQKYVIDPDTALAEFDSEENLPAPGSPIRAMDAIALDVFASELAPVKRRSRRPYVRWAGLIAACLAVGFVIGMPLRTRPQPQPVNSPPVLVDRSPDVTPLSSSTLAVATLSPLVSLPEHQAVVPDSETPASDTDGPEVDTPIAVPTPTRTNPARPLPRIETIAGPAVPAPAVRAPAAIVAVPDAPPIVPVEDEHPPAPPPAAAPTPPPPTPSAAPAALAAARDKASIESTLSRYQTAFSVLNTSAVSAVWPSVDSKALARAFRGLEQQEVALDSCDIRVAGSNADASCRGTVRYVMKVGSKSPRLDRRQWQFRLHQTNGSWIIDSVESR
jgi:hypothetical protein